MSEQNHEDIGVPGDVLDLISQKENSKVSNNNRIFKEEPIDQELVDAMLDVTERADLRKILNIKNGLNIQVKWRVEYEEHDESDMYWADATIHNDNTGKEHKFIDEEDPEDFTFAPVVQIKYKEKVIESDDELVKEVCFIGDHMLYDLEEDAVVYWRKEGDDYDTDTEEMEFDSDEEDEDLELGVSFKFSNDQELREQLNNFVPSIFINILHQYKTQYELLPFKVRRDWDAKILYTKELITEKLFEFFKESNEKNPDSLLVLKKDDIDRIIEECVNDDGMNQ